MTAGGLNKNKAAAVYSMNGSSTTSKNLGQIELKSIYTVITNNL